jgi:hypothetical protein
VPLRFDVPAWRALHAALQKLVGDAGARGGAIVGAPHGVWCAHGSSVFSGVLAATQGFLDREMTPERNKHLCRGEKWSVTRDDPGPDAAPETRSPNRPRISTAPA